MALYAIGDIHGHLAKLDGLLKLIQPGAEDRLVFLGDYVDRGPSIPELIDRLLALRTEVSCVFLRGNHEQMMLDSRRQSDSSFGDWLPTSTPEDWYYNGGAETLRQYRALAGRVEPWWDAIPEDHWRFFMETQLEHAEGDEVFVHAGFMVPGLGWEPDFPGSDPRLWIREPFLTMDHDFGALVVHGHTPTLTGDPDIRTNRLGIDTGAGHHGPLTAARFEPDRIEIIQSIG